MTLEKAYSEMMKWTKRIVSLTLLLALCATGLDLIGLDAIGKVIPTIPLTQGAGIGLAGIGFLLSKL